MKKYVAGLMFSEDRKYLALIVKNKPDWQKGLLNGIGGKIEKIDHEIQSNNKDYIDFLKENKLITEPNWKRSLNAMVREFEEETGVKTETEDWFLFLNLERSPDDDIEKQGFSVDFYRCFSDKVFDCKTIEDETVQILPVDIALCSATIDNLKWIIHLALDSNPKFTKTEY